MAAPTDLSTLLPAPGHIRYGAQTVQYALTGLSVLESAELADARDVMRDFLTTIPNTHTVPLGEVLGGKPWAAHLPVPLDTPVEVRQKTPYLAVDVLPLYIDEATRALSVYVGFKSGAPDNTGWVLPGAYVSVAKGDLCMRDAVARVLKNELGIAGGVRSVTALGQVPDFFRDPRRSCVSTVWMVELGTRPAKHTAHLQEITGLPFREFLELIARRTRLRHPGFLREYPMIWQHDSWLAALLGTPQGQRAIARILRQCRVDGIAVSEAPEINVSLLTFECPVCLEVMGREHIPTTLACGHTLCQGCMEELFAVGGPCPLCRVPIRSRAAPNVLLRSLLE